MKKLGDNMNKKLMMSLLIVVGLFFFMFLSLVIYKAVTERNVSYSKYEGMMTKAAERYYSKNDLPTLDGDKKNVSVDTLVSEGYLKSMDKVMSDTTCTGSVTVKNNGDNYLYTPTLNCATYKTKTLVDAVKDNIVTVKDGLYEVNGEYVFKGEKVNNYVSFANKTWRIVKIDKNGLLKMIKVDEEEERVVWDNRYNSEDKSTAGINNYKLSRIKDTLNNLYNNKKIFNDDSKKHIVSTNLCVGKRSQFNYNLNSDDLCGEVLENQFISLLNVTDIANASIDPGCKSLADRVCQNYNYFGQFFTSSWTITGVLENSYEVYVTSNGYSYLNNANEYDSYFAVVHVDSLENYISGNGSQQNPFVIN